MSPGCGAKSEYMKRYRDPRWAEYAACYRELLHYRRGRRLLEQAHAPWLWDAWGPASSSDSSASSASSCAGSPAPRGASASPPPPPPPAEGAARRARGSPEEPAAKPRGAEATPVPAPPVQGGEDEPEDEPEDEAGAARVPGCTRPRQHPSALFARGDRKAARSPPRPSSRTREHKHPFALYGWGERRTDTGSQRTHNVCASAPVHEIHESALRARNRRQVEKRRLAAQRQRAHSADVPGSRGPAPAAPDSPWVTEYMRCYSARA